jgi:hypothetical protein
VYQAGAVDRYGNPVAGYAVAVDFPVFAVTPKQSIEQDSVGRHPVITGLTVYAPVDSAPISPLDRFVFRGDEWEVEGEPGVWDVNPNVPVTRHGSIQFDLKRSEG